MVTVNNAITLICFFVDLILCSGRYIAKIKNPKKIQQMSDHFIKKKNTTSTVAEKIKTLVYNNNFSQVTCTRKTLTDKRLIHWSIYNTSQDLKMTRIFSFFFFFAIIICNKYTTYKHRSTIKTRRKHRNFSVWFGFFNYLCYQRSANLTFAKKKKTHIKLSKGNDEFFKTRFWNPQIDRCGHIHGSDRKKKC